MELNLQNEEARLLRQVVVQHISELKTVISNTDNFSWRQAQKEDEKTLKSILARIDEGFDDEEASEPVEPASEQAVGLLATIESALSQ